MNVYAYQESIMLGLSLLVHGCNAGKTNARMQICVQIHTQKRKETCVKDHVKKGTTLPQTKYKTPKQAKPGYIPKNA
jgi:hypothetical protein